MPPTEITSPLLLRLRAVRDAEQRAVHPCKVFRIAKHLAVAVDLLVGKAVQIFAPAVADKGGADPTLVGVTGLSVCIHADEHYIVIGIAFIKATGLNAKIDQLVIDAPAMQIFDSMGGAAVDLRQKKYLFFRRFRSRGKGGGAADRFPMMVSTACVKGISLTLMR